ncbi:MAG TPA: protein phosphatase 2C domain-containing protein [Devosia sp.]|nr:protein phosphatase 2C domain-containing protein [Devosia sp.]
MRIEAFSLGKKFGHPEANEDSFVAIPGAGYAVIDGVTDRNGTRYAGMLSGQFASRTVKRATERFLCEQQAPRVAPEFAWRGPRAFIDYLTAAIRDAYIAEGVLEAVEDDWKARAGCTVMAAIHVGERIEVVAVGDSGIRVNGTDLLQVLKPLDDVTGLLRRETWRFFEARGLSAAECDRLAASMTWLGTRNQPAGSETADQQVIGEIRKRALAACHERLPGLPDSEMLHLIDNGIAHGQGEYQNVTDKALGYGGLDGFAVPDRYVEHRSYAAADVTTLELYSDGYFEPGKGFGVEMWETAFRDVETADPHKIDRYISTKGTTPAQLTDDRTYLGVHLK